MSKGEAQNRKKRCLEDTVLIRSTAEAGLYEINGEQHWILWDYVLEGSIERDRERGRLYLPLWYAKQHSLE